MLIRALYEHWARSPQGSDISNLIEAYLVFQVNHFVLGLWLGLLIVVSVQHSFKQCLLSR